MRRSTDKILTTHAGSLPYETAPSRPNPHSNSIVSLSNTLVTNALTLRPAAWAALNMRRCSLYR